MGAVGSGKTALIEKTLKELSDDYSISVVAGDVKADIDAERIEKTGIQVVPVSTGKECHLDAHLLKHALEDLDLEETDLLLIENVGNLICPVDFDLGAHKRIVVVSSTEGDDVIEKHPEIFSNSDLTLINKLDLAKAVGADPEKMRKDFERVGNGEANTISIKENKNTEVWFDFLRELLD